MFGGYTALPLEGNEKPPVVYDERFAQPEGPPLETQLRADSIPKHQFTDQVVAEASLLPADARPAFDGLRKHIEARFSGSIRK